MYCPFCGNTLGNSRSFCGCCGKSVQFLPQSPAEGNAEGETSQDIWNMDTKSELIKKYFSEGHTYEVILDLLKTHHDVHMSLRSLTYRLNQLGLRKRGNYSNLHEVQAVIRSELRGPGQMFGYRTMWQVLKQKYNLTVKRKDIMTLLSEMNPVGSCRRRSRRFVRRVYHSMGPNYIWHVDGYDKLKPYGISVSGCIDGFSRKIMWLKCGPTNNNPAVIALNYMNCVSEHNVVPMRRRTDCGTENGTMSAIHCTLRSTQTDDFSGAASHVYGPSTANQRIESWWSHLRKQRSQFWMELLEDLKDSGHFSGSYEHKCFLRFAFLDVLQMDLDECKLLWNLHRIRPSRMSCCPAGIPNELYALPHRFNSQDCGYPVLQEQLQELETLGQDACPCGDENIQEYLTLIKHENNFQSPQTWESAVNLYLKLKEIADL